MSIFTEACNDEITLTVRAYIWITLWSFVNGHSSKKLHFYFIKYIAFSNGQLLLNDHGPTSSSLSGFFFHLPVNINFLCHAHNACNHTRFNMCPTQGRTSPTCPLIHPFSTRVEWPTILVFIVDDNWRNRKLCPRFLTDTKTNCTLWFFYFEFICYVFIVGIISTRETNCFVSDAVPRASWVFPRSAVHAEQDRLHLWRTWNPDRTESTESVSCLEWTRYTLPWATHQVRARVIPLEITARCSENSGLDALRWPN